jgi:hypothetical protein
MIEGHKIEETILLREIAKPYKMDAAESAFIVCYRHDINCVNTSAPPIQSPLFEKHNLCLFVLKKIKTY